MANKFVDFLKKNAAQNTSGLGGAILGASAIASIASGESALKVFGGTLKEVILGMASFKLMGAGMFFGMSKGIRSLVTDTGSLQAAIDKLKKIQGLHKLFEPLVGGAKAAKLEVAKLVNFSSSKGLRLDDVAQGARNLKILTRDAYSGTEALSAVADAAVGTGSSVSDMANAVGQFSATLRSGGSIAGASEQLRQMGAISQSTADSMTRLQDNGASSTQVFSVLTAALATFSGGAEKSKASIAGVSAAYDSAISSLQQKFGSPFVESDTQNTKNWTAALTAIAPVVESISGFLNILFGGMSTLGSWFAKTTAESSTMRSVVGALVKGLVILVTVVSAVSAISLAVWLLGASSGMVLFTGSTMLATVATRALGLAIAATGIGLLLVLAGTAVGMFMQYSSSMSEAKKAQEELNDAHKEAMGLLQKQIDAIKTLADQHDALAAAIANSAKAQENLNKAKMDGDPKAIAAAKEKLEQADAKVKEVANMDKTKLEGTATARKQTVDMVTRQRQEEERKHQEEMSSASPERQIELLKERAAKINKRADLAKAGDEASKKAADERETADKRKLVADAKVASLKKDSEDAHKRNKKIQDDQGNFFKFGEGDAQGQERAVHDAQMANIELPTALREQKDAEQAQKDIGKDAPEGTYERLKHDANFAQESGNIPEAEKLRIQAERALQDQQARGTDEAAAKDADAAVAAAQKQQAAAKIQLDTETAIANLKTEGYQRAQNELDLALKRIAAERAHEEGLGEGKTSQAALDKLDNEEKNINRQIEVNKREQANSVAAADSENRIAGSRERGFALEDKATSEKLKVLKEQYDREPDDDKRKALDTEAKNIRKAQGASMASRAQMGIGVGMELASQDARIKGDSNREQEIGNFSVFKEKYDALIGQGVGEAEAKDTATKFADNAISLNAMNQNGAFNSSVAGDSLSRIGGGGNVAAGENGSMLTVAQQSKKNLENIDKYTFLLYKERSKGETAK